MDSDLKQVPSSDISRKKRTKLLGMSSCHSSQVIFKSTSGSGRFVKLQPEKEKLVHVRVSPLIKVVHIYNPKVIKTDAANFRALVQELTGKQACSSARNVQQSCAKPIDKPLKDSTSRPQIQKDGHLHLQLISPSHSKSPQPISTKLKLSEASDESSSSRYSNGTNASTESNLGYLTPAAAHIKAVCMPDRIGTFADLLDESYDFVSSFQTQESNIFGLQSQL